MITLRYHNDTFPLYVYIIDMRYKDKSGKALTNGKLGYGVNTMDFRTYYTTEIRYRIEDWEKEIGSSIYW